MLRCFWVYLQALIAAVAAEGVSSPCAERPGSKKPSTPRSGAASASRSECDEEPRGNRFSPRERATGTDESQGPSQREASACPGRRGNPRIRSESCTDELLAAGRVPGLGFFSGGDGDKARDGSGLTPECQKGRCVSRSQSFDCSPWVGYERQAYADDESFKRVSRMKKFLGTVAHDDNYREPDEPCLLLTVTCTPCLFKLPESTEPSSLASTLATFSCLDNALFTVSRLCDVPKLCEVSPPPEKMVRSLEGGQEAQEARAKFEWPPTTATGVTTAAAR